MKVKEAINILNEAQEEVIATNKQYEPSKLNPSLTRLESIIIVRRGIWSMEEDEELSDIFEKRVYQVSRNQKRPRY